MNELDRRSVRVAVAALVRERFGGDYPAALEHFDVGGGGLAGWDGLTDLLAAADVGHRACRAAWAGSLLLDAGDTQGRVDWGALIAALGGP